MKAIKWLLSALPILVILSCHDGTSPNSTSSNNKNHEVILDAPVSSNAPPSEVKTEDIQSSTIDMQSAEGIASPTDSASSAPSVSSAYPLNREEYENIVENDFVSPRQDPLSTFSIDVDEASYANVRRMILDGMLPPPGAVRIEEMINYFDYQYPQPESNKPFSVTAEMAICPWNPEHRLVHIGLQGKTIPTENLPPSNFVFLVDVSGSMQEPDKLPLVQSALNMLTDRLRESDRVAMVVYAGNAGLVLPSTAGNKKQTIHQAINELEAGGSTAGGEGIRLAYEIARKNFIKNGNNRVILATDGDFNVGVSSEDELVNLITRERESGIYLSVLGFGRGNYQDHKMQELADRGNGNHSYIDGINEARKVLIQEFGSTLFTIAKDVKIQVEFNPSKVAAYRLVGYENRMLAAQDFNDDKKDAGELGSGHTVTALYEVIPAGVKSEFIKSVDPLKYQVGGNKTVSNSPELMTIKLRYKNPGEDVSNLIEQPVPDKQLSIENSSDNFRFSSSVAEFGLLLRSSAYKQSSSFEQVLTLAKSATGEDKEGYRSEFITLVHRAKNLFAKGKP